MDYNGRRKLDSTTRSTISFQLPTSDVKKLNNYQSDASGSKIFQHGMFMNSSEIHRLTDSSSVHDNTDWRNSNYAESSNGSKNLYSEFNEAADEDSDLDSDSDAEGNTDNFLVILKHHHTNLTF